MATHEAAELELVGRAELRVAGAADEAQLGRVLAGLLAPLLRKLDSPHAAVRARVVALGGHVLRRVRAGRVALPLAPLASLAAAAGEAAAGEAAAGGEAAGEAAAGEAPERLSSRVAIVFLEAAVCHSSGVSHSSSVSHASGVSHASSVSRASALDLLPPLIHRCSSRPPAVTASLLSIIIPLVASLADDRSPATSGPQHQGDPLALLDHPADFKCLLDAFLDICLYAVPPAGRPPTAASIAAARSPVSHPSALDVVPPGLSRTAVAFITNSLKAPWAASPLALRALKISLAKLTMNIAVFPERPFVLERFLIYLVCAADPASDVQAVGDDGLKRYAKPDLELDGVVSRLFSLYLGSGRPANPHPSQANASPTASPIASASGGVAAVAVGGGAAPTLPSIPESARSPASPALKLRILGFLSRSSRAANHFPFMIQVAFDALYGANTTHKLRAAGMGFVQWIARMADASKLLPIAPVLVSGLIRLIDQGPLGPGGNLDAHSLHPPSASSSSFSNEAETLRAFAYEAIGLLAKRVPSVFANDLDILSRFFAAASGESRNVRVSVQDALSNMANAYKLITTDPAPTAQKTAIERLLINNIDRPEHHARYAAVKYAVGPFPFASAFARCLCIVASADPKLEIREEAKRGLKFPDLPDVAAVAPTPGNGASQDTEEDIRALDAWRALLPTVGETVAVLEQRLSASKSASSGSPAASAAVYPGAKWIQNMTVGTYAHALEFLRQLIVLTADPRARRSELGSVEDPAELVSNYTRQQLSLLLGRMWHVEVDGTGAAAAAATTQPSSPSLAGLHGYIQFIERALQSDASDHLLHLVASSFLLELISLGPHALSVSYNNRVDWIYGFLSSTKAGTRHSMAHILGIIATSGLDQHGDGVTLRTDALRSMIDKLCVSATDTDRHAAELRHGSVLAIGFIVGRLFYRYPSPDRATKFLPRATVTKCVGVMVTAIESDSPVLVAAGCRGLAEIGRYTTLDTVQDNTETVPTWTPTTILDKLSTIVKTSRDAKAQESALFVMGHVALGTLSLVDTALEFMVTLSSVLAKHPEMQFSVGDAMCACVLGFESTHMSEFLDISGCVFPPPPPPVSTTDDVVVPVSTPDGAKSGVFIDRLIDLCQPTSSAAMRKAACIWLLCLAKHGAETFVIRTRAMALHTAFTHLLGDRDDFTQDVASKGVGVVYGIGDRGVKEDLVRSLVSTFTDGRKIAPQSVTGDTQLFDTQTLGTSPDGGGISTYQSILSLAADMNQPDLVYKFMSLASHHAIWNSRRGASMGFGSIAAQAERELQPHLKQIIPRLYRYQFDPNPRVAETMRNIWRSLVKDTKKTLDDNFDIVLRDLLQSMGDRAWRTRESSCTALSDFLHGRSVDDIALLLQDMWTMCFRCLDDIKESVRGAAFLACKTLTGMTVRYCDVSVHPQLSQTNSDGGGGISRAQLIMNTVLPFLLTKGFGSMSEDVRKYSLATILKLCQTSGVLLKPHVTDIVGTLLESLSSMEPQVMNYLSFHVDAYQVTQDQLDATRYSAARASPILDAVEQCVGQIDERVMEMLVPRLTGIIRRGIGLPTRAGTARFIYVMMQRVSYLVTPPVADTLLKAISGVLVSDRSVVVRRAFATSCAHVVKIASDDAVARFITFLRKGYLNGVGGDMSGSGGDGNDGNGEGSSGGSGDDVAKAAAAITMLELTRTASDKMQKFHGDILPLAYIGASDAQEAIRQPWTSVWEENTAGAAGAARIWSTDIFSLTESLLRSSPSWAMKRQAGASIGRLATTLRDGIQPFVASLVPLLVDALSGRTWDGKDAVLEALSLVCVHGCRWFQTKTSATTASTTTASSPDPAVVAEVLAKVEKTMVRESKKSSKPYRRVAIEYLGNVFDCIEMRGYGDVFEYLSDVAVGNEGDAAAATAAGTTTQTSLMDVDDDEDRRDRPLTLAIRANALKCIGQCFPRSISTRDVQLEHLRAVLDVLCGALVGQLWNVRLAALDGLAKVLSKVVPGYVSDCRDDDDVDSMGTDTDTATPAPSSSSSVAESLLLILDADMMNCIVRGLIASLEDGKYTSIRARASSIFYDFVHAVVGFCRRRRDCTTIASVDAVDIATVFGGRDVLSRVVDRVGALCEREVDMPIQHRIKRVLRVLNRG